MALEGFGDALAGVSQNNTKEKSVDVKNESLQEKNDKEAIKKQTMAKTNEKQKTKAKRRVKPDTSVTKGVYRDIPTSVMVAIRSEFCDAMNHTDALMAYLACHGSGSVAERANANLTETQQKLVANWDGDSYSAVVKQLEKLVSRFERMSKTTDVIELLATYMVYDRLGFRNDDPITPKATNMREDGVVDLVLAAEEQAVGFQHEKRTIQGRPIRD